MTKNILNNPWHALEIGAKFGVALVSRNPKAALSNLPELINFHRTASGLYMGKLVWFLLYKCNKKQQNSIHEHL